MVRLDLGNHTAERELWIDPSDVSYVRGYSDESGMMTEVGTKQGVVFVVNHTAEEVASKLWR